MTPTEAIDRLQCVLEEERAAIRSVDATTVESLAMEKLMLLRALSRDVLRADPDLHARFRELSVELRNNAVVLAHARNCVRDIVHLSAPPPATYSKSGGYGAPRTGTLSVTG